MLTVNFERLPYQLAEFTQKTETLIYDLDMTEDLPFAVFDWERLGQIINDTQKYETY
jgi:hypothetical protein